MGHGVGVVTRRAREREGMVGQVAVAAGASSLIYRGSPSLTTEISGGSTVIKD